MEEVVHVYVDAVPSLFDERDLRYSQKKTELKESLNLLDWDSAVDDQSYIGSCVGNAIANAYELMVRRLYPEKFVDLSRLFLYYNSRLFDNSVKEDSGTFIRDGLKAASRFGVCAEDMWPYVVSKFDVEPSPECYVDAAQRLITKYEALYTLRDLLEVLNDNRPIVIGMAIYSGFMEMGPTTSVVRLPKEGDKLVGNHAVAIVGYDLPRQLFLAKNSFGKDWGDKGYFWIPFEYMRLEVFEKWCFDISSQSTIDIDAVMQPQLHPSISNIVVEVGPNGYTVTQTTPEQSALFKT